MSNRNMNPVLAQPPVEEGSDDSDDFSLENSDAESDDMFDIFTGAAKSAGARIRRTRTTKPAMGSVTNSDDQGHRYGTSATDQSLETAAVSASRAGDQTAHQAEETHSGGNTSRLPQGFKYSALPPGMIRKLEITPADSPEDPLSAILINGFPDQSDYLALSYAWGLTFEDGSHLTNSILCNGKVFYITATLHAAILSVRSHLDNGLWHDFGRRPTLWIDAICIDQKALNERNDQVQKMDRIYRSARRVIVYLGDADDVDCEQLDRIARLPTQELSDHESCAFYHRDMGRLLDRSWFERRWVIQEFALNARRTIIVGKISIDWTQFSALIKAYEAFWDPGFDRNPRYGPLNFATVFDSTLPQRWLATNLFLFRGWKCSDPRDRIFSLLAISCGCPSAQACSRHGRTQCSSNVTVNYKLSLDEILLELSREWIRNDAMATLALASTGSDDVGVASKMSTSRLLPTWMPSAADPLFFDDPSLSEAFAFATLGRFWTNINQYFDPLLPGTALDHGFTMLEDTLHWLIRKDFVLSCLPSLPGYYYEHEVNESKLSLNRNFFNYPSGYNERQWEKVSQLPPQLKDADPKVLIVKGWILRQPSNSTTKPHELVWEEHKASKPCNWRSTFVWNSQTPCGCLQSCEPFEIFDVEYLESGELLPTQIVFLVVGYRLALILQPAPNFNQYYFIRAVLRPGPIRNLRSVWVRDIYENVWAYGSLEGPHVTAEII